MMELYDEAVDLALESNCIDVAKIYANKPQFEEKKKKLWLKVIFINNRKNQNYIISIFLNDFYKDCKILIKILIRN